MSSLECPGTSTQQGHRACLVPPRVLGATARAWCPPPTSPPELSFVQNEYEARPLKGVPASWPSTPRYPRGRDSMLRAMAETRKPKTREAGAALESERDWPARWTCANTHEELSTLEIQATWFPLARALAAEAGLPHRVAEALKGCARVRAPFAIVRVLCDEIRSADVQSTKLRFCAAACQFRWVRRFEVHWVLPVNGRWCGTCSPVKPTLIAAPPRSFGSTSGA